MGLDMYLTKKYYVKNWDHNREKYEVAVTKYFDDDNQRVKVATTIPTDKVKYIEVDAGYWRKANQIHQWFVDNCQDGNDNCGTYYVDKSQLAELLGLVNEVLADHSKAEELLPVAEGFFFGSYEYDEYYFDDLKLTKEILTEALNSPDDEIAEFYYTSSW